MQAIIMKAIISFAWKISSKSEASGSVRHGYWRVVRYARSTWPGTAHRPPLPASRQAFLQRFVARPQTHATAVLVHLAITGTFFPCPLVNSICSLPCWSGGGGLANQNLTNLAGYVIFHICETFCTLSTILRFNTG